MTDAATILGAGATGSPDAVASLANRFAQAASDVGSLGSSLTRQGTADGWEGSASQAFSAAVGDVQPELDKLVSSYSRAGSVLGAYAAALRDLQQRARHAAGRLDAAASGASQADRDRAAAHTGVEKARKASATATDPASGAAAGKVLLAASVTLKDAERRRLAANQLVQQANAEVDAIRRDFDEAVRACVRGLDDARDQVVRSDLLSGLLGVLAFTPVGRVLGIAGKVAVWLGSEARGRPMSLIRALSTGGFTHRVAGLGRYIDQKAVRATHRAWNGAWNFLGKAASKPAWGSYAKKLKLGGNIVQGVVTGFEVGGYVRDGQHGRAFATVGSAALTLPLPASALDLVTGGSVSGFVEIAIEAPISVFSGEQAITDLSDRIENGDYGPLPAWEAKYISKPLSNFIYDNFVAD
jgi:uncharacterized protein YukE